jgi:hypothetical protein
MEFLTGVLWNCSACPANRPLLVESGLVEAMRELEAYCGPAARRHIAKAVAGVAAAAGVAVGAGAGAGGELQQQRRQQQRCSCKKSAGTS